MQKLLRWFSFPIHQLERLTSDTIACILNDCLGNTKSGGVTFMIENGEALSIMNSRYCDVPAIDVVNRVAPPGVKVIPRADFFDTLLCGTWGDDTQAGCVAAQGPRGSPCPEVVKAFSHPRSRQTTNYQGEDLGIGARLHVEMLGGVLIRNG